MEAVQVSRSNGQGPPQPWSTRARSHLRVHKWGYIAGTPTVGFYAIYFAFLPLPQPWWPRFLYPLAYIPLCWLLGFTVAGIWYVKRWRHDVNVQREKEGRERRERLEREARKVITWGDADDGDADRHDGGGGGEGGGKRTSGSSVEIAVPYDSLSSHTTQPSSRSGFRDSYANIVDNARGPPSSYPGNIPKPPRVLIPKPSHSKIQFSLPNIIRTGTIKGVPKTETLFDASKNSWRGSGSTLGSVKTISSVISSDVGQKRQEDGYVDIPLAELSGGRVSPGVMV